MYYAGIDLHRGYLVAEVVDREGRTVTSARLPNEGGR